MPFSRFFAAELIDNKNALSSLQDPLQLSTFWPNLKDYEFTL